MTNSALSKVSIRIEYNRNSSPGSPRILSPELKSKNDRTISLIRQQYALSDTPWFLGFSGGKDSSALLKLTFLALHGIKQQRSVSIIYCDTNVEIPLLSSFVADTLHAVSEEARIYGIDIDVIKAQPKLLDRYFVKVIGNGYPPPTNKFRWCTDRLRISPIKQVLSASESNKGTILLGLRKGESTQRDRTLSRHVSKSHYYYEQAGYSNLEIFAPIIDYSVTDVWDTLAIDLPPKSIDFEQLKSIYKEAGGECPIIRDPKGAPCGKGRFGCWTCTVVRKDRATTNLVSNGHISLRPLLEFRSWLLEIRNAPSLRCAKRRNGSPGPGPFTLKARELILSKLLETQDQVPWELISRQEMELIHTLWDRDLKSNKYDDSALSEWALSI